jgi:hypothetical protein
LRHQFVNEIIRPINSGQTEPYQCRLDDGELYAVKGRNATPSGLIAEAISARLGKRLGLPIPDFCTCQIPADLLANAPDQNVQRSLGSETCFASHWVEPADVFNLAMIKRVGDTTLAKVYVFDHWIMNGDRSLTPKGGNVNLLFALSTEELIAFDHNLAFSDSHRASDLEVHVGRASWKRVKQLPTFRRAMETKMTELLGVAMEVMEELPMDWLEAAPNMPQRVLAALERVKTEEFWDELG